MAGIALADHRLADAVMRDGCIEGRIVHPGPLVVVDRKVADALIEHQQSEGTVGFQNGKEAAGILRKGL